MDTIQYSNKKHFVFSSFLYTRYSFILLLYILLYSYTGWHWLTYTLQMKPFICCIKKVNCATGNENKNETEMSIMKDIRRIQIKPIRLIHLCNSSYLIHLLIQLNSNKSRNIYLCVFSTKQKFLPPSTPNKHQCQDRASSM